MSNFREAFIFQIQILLTQLYSALDMTLQEPYFVSTGICVQLNSLHFRLCFIVSLQLCVASSSEIMFLV
jgi:hypothetical protein